MNRYQLGHYSLPLLNSSNIPKLPIKVKRRAVGSPEEFNPVTKQLGSNALYLCIFYRDTWLLTKKKQKKENNKEFQI